MIEIEKLNKTYDKKNKALRDINISIRDGEFVFIMGKSGSGKSTLMKLLLKELEPTSGRIVVNDMDLGRMPRRYVPKYRRRLGVVFQDFRLLKDKTVYENVAFAQRVIGISSRRIRESVPAILRQVGLSSKYKSFPDQLSGGEQQRVAIARALINRPEVLLADEPTGNLDDQNSMEIMGLLDQINRRGTTVIVVTHSHEIVERMGKRVITIDKGCVVGDWISPEEERELQWSEIHSRQREEDAFEEEPGEEAPALPSGGKSRGRSRMYRHSGQEKAAVGDDRTASTGQLGSRRKRGSRRGRQR